MEVELSLSGVRQGPLKGSLGVWKTLGISRIKVSATFNQCSCATAKEKDSGSLG